MIRSVMNHDRRFGPAIVGFLPCEPKTGEGRSSRWLWSLGAY